MRGFWGASDFPARFAGPRVPEVGPLKRGRPMLFPRITIPAWGRSRRQSSSLWQESMHLMLHRDSRHLQFQIGQLAKLNHPHWAWFSHVHLAHRTASFEDLDFGVLVRMCTYLHDGVDSCWSKQTCQHKAMIVQVYCCRLGDCSVTLLYIDGIGLHRPDAEHGVNPLRTGPR